MDIKHFAIENSEKLQSYGQLSASSGMVGLVSSGTLSFFGVDIPIVAALSFSGTIFGAFIMALPKLIELMDRKEQNKIKQKELAIREMEAKVQFEMNYIEMKKFDVPPQDSKDRRQKTLPVGYERRYSPPKSEEG